MKFYPTRAVEAMQAPPATQYPDDAACLKTITGENNFIFQGDCHFNRE